MMALAQLALLCFVALAASQMFDILRPKTVRIDKFSGLCPDHKDAPIIFQNVHLQLKDRLHMISLKIVTKEDIQEGIKLKLNLKRCQSKEALDSCEKYQTIRLNRLCDLVNGDNKPWSPFVKMAQPPISCPLKKGVNVVKNGTFDGSAFSHFPISGWYWIVEALVLGEETNKVVMCVTLEGQLVPV